MNNKFKAIVLNQTGDQFSREIKNLDKSFFKSGDVLVKVEYSGLNYKDALILKNGGKLVKEYPHIPGIDFSGKVIESETPDFKSGDDVVLTGCRVGEIYPGGYSQLVKVKSELLVKKPESISNKNAMILGTAGFTSLLCAFAIKAREELLLGDKMNDVLVTGATGGVGSMSVMVLSKMGYKVTAVTGKKDKVDFLKKLGASAIIDRKELEVESRPLDKGLWDGVVDTAGGKILANAISHTRPNGIVAACGLVSDYKLHTTVMPFKIPVPTGHIWDSFLRVFLGLSLGIIFGVPLGIFMGLNRFAKGFFDPLVELYRPVPPLAWAPLVITVFGIDNVGKIFLLFMVAFSIMIISARAGASGTQLSKIHAAHSLGASRWQILRNVILPNSLPEILTGIRVAVGMCWGTLVAAEFLAGTTGIGFVENVARKYMQYEVIWITIFVMGMLGLLFDLTIRKIIDKTIPWRGKG